jgi:hypothetical protein
VLRNYVGLSQNAIDDEECYVIESYTPDG